MEDAFPPRRASVRETRPFCRMTFLSSSLTVAAGGSAERGGAASTAGRSASKRHPETGVISMRIFPFREAEKGVGSVGAFWFGVRPIYRRFGILVAAAGAKDKTYQSADKSDALQTQNAPPRLGQARQASSGI